MMREPGTVGSLITIIDSMSEEVHSKVVRLMVYFAASLMVQSSALPDRTFLAMEVSTGQAQLLELVKAVDSTMGEFNLDTFYKV